jgi:hypothetical protein
MNQKQTRGERREKQRQQEKAKTGKKKREQEVLSRNSSQKIPVGASTNGHRFKQKQPTVPHALCVWAAQ